MVVKVENSYLDILNEYNLQLQAIGYDPHNADGFLGDLEEFGVPLLEIRQSARFLHDGTEDMQLCIESGKIKYNKKEELLSYSVSNAKIVRNSFNSYSLLFLFVSTLNAVFTLCVNFIIFLLSSYPSP